MVDAKRNPLNFSPSELKHLNVLSWSQSITCPSLVKFVNGSLEISSLRQAFLSWYARGITILSMQLVYRQLKWWWNPSLQHCSGDCGPFTGDKHYQIELRKYMSRYYVLFPPAFVQVFIQWKINCCLDLRHAGAIGVLLIQKKSILQYITWIMTFNYYGKLNLLG